MKITKILVGISTLCIVFACLISCSSNDTAMTIGQRNALEKAEDYLRYSAFSREGLINQLEFEGFEENDIVFAVNNVEVDWNEQCYKKAKSYLRYSSFSKQGLIDQLEFEGFTDAQIAYAIEKVGYGSVQGDNENQENEISMTIGQRNALEKAEDYLRYSAFSREGLIDQLEYEGFEENDIIFAVDNVEVDWNEQCYKKAKSYLQYSSFSKQGLIDQLEFEGFTDAQIAYAIEKVGY